MAPRNDPTPDDPSTRVSADDGTPRRAFLKGALAAGAVAALGAVGTGCSRKSDADASRAKTPALTPDGRIVHVDADTAAHMADGDADDPRRAGVPGRKWVMVIDLARCGGAKQCVSACQRMHALPADREWIRVFEMQNSPEEAPYWFPKPCFHCDNPPCTKVCPVGATFKRTDGVVAIDNERCIGCRFCMAACPYSARSFNWGKPTDPHGTDHAGVVCSDTRPVGTVEKCDFCADMAGKGVLPDCANACPNGTIYFGDEYEDAVTNSLGETERLSELLRTRAGYRHLEELGTKPRVFYLPPKNRLLPAPDERRAAARSSHS